MDDEMLECEDGPRFQSSVDDANMLLQRSHTDFESLVQNPPQSVIFSAGFADRQEDFEKDISPSSYAKNAIHYLFESFIDLLESNTTPLCIRLKTKPSPNRSGDTSASDLETFHDIRFPGKDAKEAWKFSTLIRVFELIYEAILNDALMTKRDMYYRDPALFGKQSVVDRHVDDIARTLGVSRSDLNMGAAAKGIFAGNMSINHVDGTSVSGSQYVVTLIPSIKQNDAIIVKNIRWILLVEKEATFRSLVSLKSLSSLLAQSLLLTGKGYPDLVTRVAVNRLSSELQDNPFDPVSLCGIMDFDPDGIAILSTYKYGSATLAHETKSLPVPHIRWLGIRSRDIGAAGELSDGQGLLSLTARDRGRAISMLNWWHLDEQGPETEWRRELQVMLMLNFKAEIQIVDDTCSKGLSQWLEKRLLSE